MSSSVEHLGTFGMRDIAPFRTNTVFMAIFDVLYILGPVSLAVILMTAWRSSNVRRPSTWFMAVGSWVIIGVANIILIGRQTGHPPPHGVCLTQAVLIYASPAFCAFSAAAFLLETYLAMSRFMLPDFLVLNTRHILFYIIPCTVALSVAIEVLMLGLLNPRLVNRDVSGFYCNLSSPTPRKTTGAAIMCGLVLVLILEGKIILAYRRSSRESTDLFDLELLKKGDRPNISKDHVFRIMVFTICAFIAFIVSASQYFPNFVFDNRKVSLVQASLPCCASLIFGTQRDILSAWIPARYQKDALANEPSFSIVR